MFDRSATERTTENDSIFVLIVSDNRRSSAASNEILIATDKGYVKPQVIYQDINQSTTFVDYQDVFLEEIDHFQKRYLPKVIPEPFYGIEQLDEWIKKFYWRVLKEFINSLIKLLSELYDFIVKESNSTRCLFNRKCFMQLRTFKNIRFR